MTVQLDLYVEEAVREAGKLQKKGLIALVLDEWRDSPRLTYQFPTTESCDSDCLHCPLLKLVGRDPPGGFFRKDSLIKTLIEAGGEDLRLFPGQQCFLNCKTWHQYLSYHTASLLRRCRTGEDFEKELKLVRSFRLIFQQGNFLPQMIETAGRAYIIRLVQKVIEPPRRRLFEQAAEKTSLGRFLT